MGVGVYFTFVGTFCWVAMRANAKFTARQTAINEFIRKHQDGVFSSKQCTVKLMPYHTYIAISFAWRPKPTSVLIRVQSIEASVGKSTLGH